MSVDMTGVEELKKAVENLNYTKDELIYKITKELTARLLRMVTKRTPVGASVVVYKSVVDVNNKHVLYKSGKKKGQAKYKKETTHTGGTLRRGWTVTDLSYFGNYEMKIGNNVFYAVYVEEGHRQAPGRYVPAIGKRLKKSWVPGKHMLRISVEDLQKKAPAIIEKKVQTWINETNYMKSS